MKKLLLLISFIILHYCSFTQIDVQGDNRVNPVLKRALTQKNDYITYGRSGSPRSYLSSTGSRYSYGFNGKENDNDVKGEGDQQDYGFSVYDPRIGKFLSVDQITKDYSWYPPYQYAGNTRMQGRGNSGEPGSANDRSSSAEGTRSNCANRLMNDSTPVMSFEDVADYIAHHGTLPSNYITKAQATALGWNPKAGNLDSVAPGKSIGGDIFRNAEGKLPNATGRIWYEADINYSRGHRGADRLVYSNDKLYYKTTDHYRTFTQIKL